MELVYTKNNLINCSQQLMRSPKTDVYAEEVGSMLFHLPMTLGTALSILGFGYFVLSLFLKDNKVIIVIREIVLFLGGFFK